MDNQAKGKDYIIFAKSSEVKSKWMDAFQREKDRVAQDKESGLCMLQPDNLTCFETDRPASKQIKTTDWVHNHLYSPWPALKLVSGRS